MEEKKVVWCGLDVGKDEFYAALDLPGEDGNKNKGICPTLAFVLWH